MKESTELKELYVISGPTACGKTGLALALAGMINGEIISADSMQVYKYMDIGTAKIKESEKRGIKHYLIDELYPDEEFSVALFQKKAQEYIADIKSRGKIPIIVGGTGFYIASVLYGNEFTETKKDTEFRERMYKLASEKGNGCVHKMLETVDEGAARAIHPNNLKRIIRALEYHRQTGEKISRHNMIERQRKLMYNVSVTVLTLDREIMYERINRRVDKMFEEGLVNEVKTLLDMGYAETLVSMQGLGYKETAAYLNGRCSLEQSVYDIKIGTRHFAKRQLTWFRNSADGRFINACETSGEKEICETIIGDDIG